MKPPYLLAKNSHDVLNVHNLVFLEWYFMAFAYYTFSSDGCGKRK